MLPENFSISKQIRKILTDWPSFKIRDKDIFIHNAGDAAKCLRQLGYKALGYKESNPIDYFGKLKLEMGNWIEAGLRYRVLPKMWVYGYGHLQGQVECGEHGTFYGTSWHGYMDDQLGIANINGKIKPVVVELKTKVGKGADFTVKQYPGSKTFLIPEPDTTWGNAQQISLYLRDVYQKTVNNPQYSEPVKDGILLQFLYSDNIRTFIEYFYEYIPEKDQVICYRVQSQEYPEINSELEVVIDLKEIATRWKALDQYLEKKELPPPDFERRYDINDKKVMESTKAELQRASKGEVIIGDMRCKYCNFRDQCAKDLNINLTYTADEKKRLKQYMERK